MLGPFAAFGGVGVFAQQRTDADAVAGFKVVAQGIDIADQLVACLAEVVDGRADKNIDDFSDVDLRHSRASFVKIDQV